MNLLEAKGVNLFQSSGRARKIAVRRRLCAGSLAHSDETRQSHIHPPTPNHTDYTASAKARSFVPFYAQRLSSDCVLHGARGIQQSIKRMTQRRSGATSK